MPSLAFPPSFLRTVALALSLALALAMVLFFCLPASAEDSEDRIGVPGPLSFDGTDYTLEWSSNPSPGYFKQEYVPAGQTVERYRSMILVEVAAGVNVNAALAAQTNMLNQRKGSDPLVNLDVIRNHQSGELILDFIVSDKDEKGEYIAEWNAYRYVPLPDGQSTMLFAISHRAYGNDEVRAFLANLKSVRPDQINKIARYELPDASASR